jgi:hypothetical protein
MLVTNVNGTSNNTCKCGDWLSHWKKHSGQPLPQFCSETRCAGNELVGAHVQKVGPGDKSWYIIPLCKKCSDAKGATLTVGDHVKLVPAADRSTCGT